MSILIVSTVFMYLFKFQKHFGTVIWDMQLQYRLIEGGASPSRVSTQQPIKSARKLHFWGDRPMMMDWEQQSGETEPIWGEGGPPWVLLCPSQGGPPSPQMGSGGSAWHGVSEDWLLNSLVTASLVEIGWYKFTFAYLLWEKEKMIVIW